MKIRKLTPEYYSKAASLLDHAFAPSRYEVQLFDKLHEQNRPVHEWVGLIRDSVVAYIGFTNAYNGKKIVGLHLGPIAVQPQMQRRGIGSELLRFALRQGGGRENTIFVFGDVKFYFKFGFEPCPVPRCPFDKGNRNFLSIRNETGEEYTVGYEPEFTEIALGKNQYKMSSRKRGKF
ncbi:GNAT family N-acetyltransferase [Desulfobulbus elongatus]|uniref:GNAT family N-acetyltransferase n=1 Tax=Desulfobulbus elongatus TaxID=53332 RepID=UPI0004859B9C|nr:N-acetyltransferase [Desulfobulbus elongatus]